MPSTKIQIITHFIGQVSPLRSTPAAATSGILSSPLIAGTLTMSAPLCSLRSRPPFFKPLKAKSCLGSRRRAKVHQGARPRTSSRGPTGTLSRMSSIIGLHFRPYRPLSSPYKRHSKMSKEATSNRPRSGTNYYKEHQSLLGKLKV
jgi:hypothetical protein